MKLALNIRRRTRVRISRKTTIRVVRRRGGRHCSRR